VNPPPLERNRSGVDRPRVASLLPATTEIVCALGLESSLAGRSHECDFPPTVRNLPILTRPRVNPEAPSRAIDSEVERLLRDALSLYDVDTAQLRALKPDFVLTQSRCEVCTVNLEDVRRALADWTGARPEIISLAPAKLEDVWRDIERVAHALGVPERGGDVANSLRARIEDIAGCVASPPESPAVLCLDWIDPPMAAGYWVPELVAMAGGRPLAVAPGASAPRLEWSAIAGLDPDVIVAMPCGFGLERTREEMGVLKRNPVWAHLRAVREGRVYLADGNAYFNRPGPRLVESLEILAEILHPGEMEFGHRGTGWVR
jgi:iron complex transport system substrate-binding protein